VGTAGTSDIAELSRRAADAFNRRDLDAYLALQAKDVLGVPLATDMEGEYHGHGGTKRWWKAQFDAFPDLTIEILDMTEHGDATVAALRMRGHGAGGSVPVDMEIWRVTRWRDGHCYWWASYRSEADALAAVEQP
jgi:ketosteroid isomerase-like protein